MMNNAAIENELIRRIKTHLNPMEVRETEISEYLQKLPGIKAILFDIYGTLIISGSGDIGLTAEENREQAIRSALREAEIRFTSKDATDEIAQYFINEIEAEHQKKKARGIDFPEIDIRATWKNVLQKSSSEGLTKPLKNDHQILILAIEYESHMNPCWLMPGTMEILEFLNGKDIITGIVSNAQFFTKTLMNALTEKKFHDLGFKRDLCYFSYEHGVAKPSTRLFEQAGKRLKNEYDVDYNQVLYVGNDMLNDIATASKCGFKTALFAGDARSLRLRANHPAVQDVKPDIILKSLLQLKKCI